MITDNQKDVLNRLNPSLEAIEFGDKAHEISNYAPVVFEYNTGAINSAAVDVFTAPFPLKIINIFVEGRNAEAMVLTPSKKDVGVMCTAITAADGTLVQMSAGVVAARTVLDTGDVVQVQSTEAASRAYITFLCERL